MDFSATPLTGSQIAKLVKSEVLLDLEHAPMTDPVRAMIRCQLGKSGRILAKSPSAFMSHLIFESFRSAGGEATGGLLKVAATMEYYIAAADVVDDLQDNDHERYSSIGDAAEIIYLLLVCAHRAIGKLENNGVIGPVLKIFTDLELIAMGGQHDDIQTSLEQYVSIEDALDIAKRKSGTFGRCAAHLGAMLATSDATVIEQHAEFGSLVATISQISNDIVGVWPGDDESTDIALKRKTLPIAAGVLRHSETNSSETQTDLLTLDENTSVQDVKEELLNSGAVHAAWEVAETLRQRAVDIGEKLRIDNPASRLVELVREPTK